MLTLADDAACRCETEFSDDDERPNRCEVHFYSENRWHALRQVVNASLSRALFVNRLCAFSCGSEFSVLWDQHVWNWVTSSRVFMYGRECEPERINPKLRKAPSCVDTRKNISGRSRLKEKSEKFLSFSSEGTSTSLVWRRGNNSLSSFCTSQADFNWQRWVIARNFKWTWKCKVIFHENRRRTRVFHAREKIFRVVKRKILCRSRWIWQNMVKHDKWCRFRAQNR